MRGLSELVVVQLVSRAKYLSLSEQRPWGALYGALPGELQGSDRAEIWAILQLLERTPGDLVVGTDCDYLVKCFHKRWWARKGCFKNGDLWCRIGTALNRKRKVIVYKVGAHVLAPDSPLELAMSLLTLLLRKGPFSMRSRFWQSAYRGSSIPRPYRLFPN